jgi:hypothetical protein
LFIDELALVANGEDRSWKTLLLDGLAQEAGNIFKAFSHA